MARWMAIAESDWRAAELLAANGLPSQAVFHTHLWVEKVLKALVTERLTLAAVPRTHNLRTLLSIAVENPPRWLESFLGTLSPHSTSSRYALAPESLVYTAALAQTMLDGAKEATGWLNKLLT
jgi:HEPN domain-containing protein